MRPLYISKLLNLLKPLGKHNIPPAFFVKIGKTLEKHKVPLQCFMKIRRIQEKYYIFPRVLQYSIFQGYIMFLSCSERVF
jgi:hypothetical protein